MQYLLIAGLGSWLNNMFHKILLLIDGCIYWAVSQVYQIFIKLADARIFEDAFFSNFAKRIYAIIGVVMLFYLAYALLTALVDPDKATSGEKSLTKLAQNIVISLVLLGFLPTIFDYAYKIQGIIFKENVIGAIIFGSGSTNSESISTYGNYMAYTALNPFLNPGNYNVRLDNNYSWFDLKYDLIENGEYTKLPILSDWAIEDQELISPAEEYSSNSKEENILPEGTSVSLGYKPIISTACGVALLYIIFSFCLDLGIRTVKFAFCQLIAPIPVVMRMIPGKKGTFDKWLKLTLTVYFEVFIRVAIMYLVIYFFSEIANSDMFKYQVSGIQGLIVLAIILMGLLAFAKQAPKMLSDMLGLDSGNIKLGIKDKLKAGGFFAAGAAVGAGTQMAARKVVGGGQNIWKDVRARGSAIKTNFKDSVSYFGTGNVKKGFTSLGKTAGNVVGIGGDVVSGAVATTAGVVAGSASGAVNSFTHGGKDAKGFGDSKKAAKAGVATATEHAVKRATFKANHTNPDNKLRKIPIVGNAIADQAGVVKGHMVDVGSGVANFVGITPGIDNLKVLSASISSVETANKELKDVLKYIRESVEKNNRLVSYTYNDVSGTSHVVNNENLANLKENFNLMQTTGKDSSGHNVTGEDITNMKFRIDAAEKQANKDILSGIKTDGRTKTSADDYSPQLKAALTKIMTTTRAAKLDLKSNIQTASSNTKIDNVITFSENNYNNKTFVNDLISGRVDPTVILNDLGKPLSEAKYNVQNKINKFQEKQDKK